MYDRVCIFNKHIHLPLLKNRVYEIKHFINCFSLNTFPVSFRSPSSPTFQRTCSPWRHRITNGWSVEWPGARTARLRRIVVGTVFWLDSPFHTDHTTHSTELLVHSYSTSHWNYHIHSRYILKTAKRAKARCVQHFATFAERLWFSH